MVKTRAQEMRNTIDYEWDIETVDGEDVVDHYFSDKLDYTKAEFSEAIKAGTLTLVRTVGNDYDGVTERTWAYVKDGKLPTMFSDCYGTEIHKVPIKFHKEFAKYEG
jgi:hypothetical protein